ncbi:MAG: HEPN domain-containing protein [Candidatus Azobacteroides sp.]|nr:HEPN domain-containing protein [Candidatus Azobacteroides sp.]
MSLKEAERKEIVKFRLKKANDTFAEISVQMENKFYRTAANRLYYACYYAVTALLINDGYETHTHNGVKTLLGLRYINNNKIEKSFGKMYRQLFNLRQTGDYEDWINFEEEDIKPFLEPAGQFIAAIEKLIEETNND